MTKRKYSIINIAILLAIALSTVVMKCNRHNNESKPADIDYIDTTHNDNVYVILTDTTTTDSSNAYMMPPDTARIGKTTITIGNKPTIESKVWIWGNKSFYNTKTYHPFSLSSYGNNANDITEPSWFLQLQYEFKKDTYLGIHVNKEKFRANKYYFGFAGPTDIGLSYGLSFHPFENDWLSTNVSLAGGYTIGKPRFETPWWEPLSGTQVIFTDKTTLGNKYEIIGMFTTLITRFDIHIERRINLFVAATLNYRFIQDYETSIGTQKTGEIYSFGINVGIGINFNYKKNKKGANRVNTFFNLN